MIFIWENRVLVREIGMKICGLHYKGKRPSTIIIDIDKEETPSEQYLNTMLLPSLRYGGQLVLMHQGKIWDSIAQGSISKKTYRESISKDLGGK